MAYQTKSGTIASEPPYVSSPVFRQERRRGRWEHGPTTTASQTNGIARLEPDWSRSVFLAHLPCNLQQVLPSNSSQAPRNRLITLTSSFCLRADFGLINC